MNYNRLTLQQLRESLQARGLSLEGSKRELIHRLKTDDRRREREAVIERMNTEAYWEELAHEMEEEENIYLDEEELELIDRDFDEMARREREDREKEENRLIKGEINFQIVNPETGVTNFMIVAANGKSEEVKVGLNQGINPNQQDNQGNTPLIYAVVNGRRDNLDLLLEEGANPNLANNGGGSPLAYAIEKNEPIISQMLVEAGANLEDLSESLQEDYRDLVQILNRIPTINLASCRNQEDPITFAPLTSRGTISIQWSPENIQCFDLRTLRKYLLFQQDGRVVRDPHGRFIEVFLIPPLYYITNESSRRLLESENREYQAFTLYDQVNIGGTTNSIYTLVPKGY